MANSWQDFPEDSPQVCSLASAKAFSKCLPHRVMVSKMFQRWVSRYHVFSVEWAVRIRRDTGSLNGSVATWPKLRSITQVTITHAAIRVSDPRTRFEPCSTKPSTYDDQLRDPVVVAVRCRFAIFLLTTRWFLYHSRPTGVRYHDPRTRVQLRRRCDSKTDRGSSGLPAEHANPILRGALCSSCSSGRLPCAGTSNLNECAILPTFALGVHSAGPWNASPMPSPPTPCRLKAVSPQPGPIRPWQGSPGERRSPSAGPAPRAHPSVMQGRNVSSRRPRLDA